MRDGSSQGVPMVMLLPTYLIEERLVKTNEVVSAVLDQQGRRPRFGELAVLRGKLTKEDCERVLEQSRKSRARFGQLAVQLGSLSTEAVEELLREQQSLEPSLADVLVERGSLSPSALSSAVAVVGAGDADIHATERAARSWGAVIAALAQVRPFSDAVSRALVMLDDPKESPAGVAAVLEKDQAMPVALLRLANSGLYRRGAPCEGVADAVVRLGLTNVRDLVVGLGLLGTFTDRTAIAFTVRNHAAGVAALCRLLAQAVAPHLVKRAFLCGLLHDVGKLLLLQSGEFSYTDLPSRSLETAGETREAERRVLGFDHATLGFVALSLWELPGPVAEAVGLHHTADRRHAQSAEIAQLAALVSLCDRLEHHLAFSPQYTALVEEEVSLDPDARHFGLDAGHIEEMWVELVAARSETIGVLMTA